jgi:hypothetical protein
VQEICTLGLDAVGAGDQRTMRLPRGNGEPPIGCIYDGWRQSLDPTDDYRISTRVISTSRLQIQKRESAANDD